ncbi:MAG: hypothetical protein V3V56_09705, partial [bacterium]
MSPSPARQIVSAPSHRLAPRLGPVLAEMAAGDPLRPRRVLVISSALRDHLQARLARESPLAGVSFLTLEQLAREKALPEMLREGLRPLPRLGEDQLGNGFVIGGPALMETVLGTLRDRLGPLCPPPGIQGYGGTLYETWKDSAEGLLSVDDLRACAHKFRGADARRLDDLALIIEAFENRLERLRYFDQPHLLARACEILEAAPGGTPAILYGFSDMNALQRRLALAACAGAGAAAFVPADPDAPACAFARPFLRWLESEGFTPAESSSAADGSFAEGPFEKLGRRLFATGAPVPPPEGSVQIVSAPAASREAFELCREILHEREKPAAPESAGLLLPSRKDYDPLFREILGGMGIPVTVSGEGSLAACPAGRTFLRMISLKSQDYPRPEVMRFLDEGGLPASAFYLERLKAEEIDPGAAVPADWEYRSRDLPYLSGEKSWRGEIRRALSGRDDDPQLQSLALALDLLFGQLGARPESALSSEHAEK